MSEPELDTLTGGAPRVLSAGGCEIAVTPLKVGRLPAFARALRPAWDALMPVFAAAGDGLAPEDVLDAMADGGEPLLDAVAVAIGQPREWVDGLDADELIALVAAVWEVNRDFFVTRLGPALSRAAPRVMATDGSPSPSDSSAPATATPT